MFALLSKTRSRDNGACESAFRGSSGRKKGRRGRKSERKATGPEERSLEGRYLFRGGCERRDGTAGRAGKGREGKGREGKVR